MIGFKFLLFLSDLEPMKPVRSFVTHYMTGREKGGGKNDVLPLRHIMYIISLSLKSKSKLRTSCK